MILRASTQFLHDSWKYLINYAQETKFILLSSLGIERSLLPALNWECDSLLDKPSPKPSNNILESLLGDGYLWAVPAKRRSLEKRLTRKLSRTRLIPLKRNLLTCNVCGHYHEAHAICGNCYQKVKEETKLIQDAIQQELKLNPVDKEIVVLYENEKSEEMLQLDKKIVEIKKPPPQWFSRNLLTKVVSPSNSISSGTHFKTEK